MNDLEKYFNNNDGKALYKWKHYFEIYDRHLAKFRGKKITVVEFGVLHGGSLAMWKDYFGPEAIIYGVDINPLCASLQDEQVRILIGDQDDRTFLKSMRTTIPQIEILIDDGGHTMSQQKKTFEELYKHISKDGVYICEDLHTSYWKKFGGGYKKRGSFIEYSKNLVDDINAWHSENKRRLDVNEITRTTNSLHYYDSMLVIEKREMQPPEKSITGTQYTPKSRPRKIAKYFRNLLNSF